MSKITLPISELKPALIGLSRIIAKRTTLPVLNHLKIERTKDGWTRSETAPVNLSTCAAA